MNDDERLGLRGHIRGEPDEKQESPAVVVQAQAASASAAVGPQENEE